MTDAFPHRSWKEGRIFFNFVEPQQALTSDWEDFQAHRKILGVHITNYTDMTISTVAIHDHHDYRHHCNCNHKPMVSADHWCNALQEDHQLVASIRKVHQNANTIPYSRRQGQSSPSHAITYQHQSSPSPTNNTTTIITAFTNINHHHTIPLNHITGLLCI